jgi:hypothetical protein
LRSSIWVWFIIVLVFAALAPTASSPELALAQNLIRNGDFSNGLSKWTPVVSDPGRAGDGYPKWGIEVDPHVGIASAYLDVPAGAFAWLDSDPFFMPDTGTVSVTMWGHHDSVDLGVQVAVQGGPTFVLDHFDPPKTEHGQVPVTRGYVLGTNVAGRSIAIRLTCHDLDDHWVGTFCDFANVIVTSGATSSSVTSTAAEYPVLHGVYADVDWSKFSGYPTVALWAQRTADAEYEHLELVQGIPANHMRRSLIRLD